MTEHSAPDLPLGRTIEFAAARRPERAALPGRYSTLRPVQRADAPALYRVSHPPHGDLRTWFYLPTGPYESVADMEQSIERQAGSEDPLFFTVVVRGEPAGIASYMRITPEHGSIEIGHIWFGVTLRRTTAATEAIYLLARHAFDDLGYRRLEWKCDALNAASKRAAERFGFTFEGTFRQHQVIKGRNRDTAWFSIIDGEWPRIRAGFEAWLATENFSPSETQRRPLNELIAIQRGSR